MSRIAHQKRLIIMLEDRAHVREGFKEYFDSIGYEFHGAATIREALEEIESNEHEVHTVIVDKNLERENDGLVFIETTIHKHPSMRFVLYTAFALDDTEIARLNQIGILYVDKSDPDAYSKLLGGIPLEDHAGRPLGAGFNEFRTQSHKSPTDRHKLMRLQQDNDRLKTTLSEIAEELIVSIRATQSDTEGSIEFDGRSFSSEELVHEILTGTPTGLRLIQLHHKANKEIEQLAKRLLAKSTGTSGRTADRDGE